MVGRDEFVFSSAQPSIAITVCAVATLTEAGGEVEAEGETEHKRIA